MKIAKTTINILVVSLVIIFTSCKVYKLRYNDNEWQPYKKGDVLIFENSNGKFDTISVKKSNTRNSKLINPYSFYEKKHQVNSSIGELSNTEPTIVESRPILFKRHICLVSISSEDDTVNIGFSEYKPAANFDISISIKEMNLFLYKDNLYGECFKIINIDNYINGGFKSILTSLLFSKKYGCLEFKFKDGSFAKLKEFIRDGKNIL